MIRRLCLTAAFLTPDRHLGASGQVVRFQTTVGDFDMVLNPTNNPVLQGHVDNMLEYVDADRYRGSWINRAAENFVLQMGGFYSHTQRVPMTIEHTHSVGSFGNVLGAPASTIRPLEHRRHGVACSVGPADRWHESKQRLEQLLRQSDG